MLALKRGHWAIENRLHWRKDVTFGKDASLVHTGQGPTVQAAFGTLWTTVADISGLDPMQIKVFLAIGMLLNDVAAMDVANLDDAWARVCLAPVPIAFSR